MVRGVQSASWTPFSISLMFWCTGLTWSLAFLVHSEPHHIWWFIGVVGYTIGMN